MLKGGFQVKEHYDENIGEPFPDLVLMEKPPMLLE